jgi:S-adenosylmethionine-diacylglycerol 3-amino-3-carboxypropyl transferase
MTDYLAEQPASSADCFVLLDAQDWMDDATLNALWTQITRTARPGARVIFRTAADEKLLPGRVCDDILRFWTRDDTRSAALHARDRSAIYGAFHLYRFAGAAA